MIQYAITTSDNPINPLDDFKSWFVFDCLIFNYNTSALLSRIAKTSDGLSDEENNRIISEAIDEIIKNIPAPNGEPYIKVVQDVEENVYGTN